jgi:hypothetical protein
MPSTNGADSIAHHSIPTDVGLAMQDMSMYDTPGASGREEDYEELRTPLGQNIEHACRQVLAHTRYFHERI